MRRRPGIVPFRNEDRSGCGYPEGLRGQYECDVNEVWAERDVILASLLLGGTYPAMVRLLGEDLRLASCDGEVGLWDLEDLGVV